MFKKELVGKHFSEGQIKGFMNDLELSYTEAVLYLWFYNFVSICQKDLKTDNGRPMYLRFARSAANLIEKSQ